MNLKIPETSKYKVLIFDLFHTLSSMAHSNVPGQNSHELIGVTRQQWLDALFSNTDGRLRGKIKDHKEMIRDIINNLGIEVDDPTLENLAKIRYERFKLSLANVLDNTVDTIRELKARGKKIVLLSNADLLEKDGWKDSPLAEHFDHAVFSCDVGLIKPEPEIYHYAINLTKAQKHECLFIGDGGSDELTGAKNTGIECVLTTEFIQDLWPEHIEERLKIADYHIININQLLLK